MLGRTAWARSRRGLRQHTNGTHGLVRVRGVRPGREHFPAVSSAAASFPLHSLLGNVPSSPAQQTAPDGNNSRNHYTNDYPTSAAQLPPGPAATIPHRHHVSNGGAFVMGSPPGTLGGSHTQPANCGLAAHGCYRIIGPARITKRGECLIARMLPGSRLELLSGGGPATRVQATSGPPPQRTQSQQRQAPSPSGAGRAVTAEAAAVRLWAEYGDVQCACTSDEDGSASDDGAVTECVLVAAYVELGGSASSVDRVDLALQPAVHHHNGRTYLSVRNLPPTAIITLGADGDLSHPVNVTPPPS